MMNPSPFRTRLSRLFLWYAALHYSYVWLTGVNPYAGDGTGDDVLTFVLLKNMAWGVTLLLLLVRWEESRQTFIIGGVMPKGHALLALGTAVCLLAVSFGKQPLALLGDLFNLLGFSFATVLALHLIRDEGEMDAYSRLVRRIGWVVLAFGIFQKLCGYVGPHFGRILSTLGGPELLSLFAVFLLGHYLFQLRHGKKKGDALFALLGIAGVVVVQLYAVTLTGQLLMVLYLLLAALVLRGRVMMLLLLGVCLLLGGAWASDLFRDTVQKIDGFSGGMAYNGRWNEHGTFWTYLLQKATLSDLLIGASEPAKYENLFYSLLYNTGFFALLGYALLLWNAWRQGLLAWRAVAARGNTVHAHFVFLHFAYFTVLLVGSHITPYLDSFPIHFYAWMSLGIALRMRDLAERSSASCAS